VPVASGFPTGATGRTGWDPVCVPGQVWRKLAVEAYGSDATPAGKVRGAPTGRFLVHVGDGTPLLRRRTQGWHSLITTDRDDAFSDELTGTAGPPGLTSRQRDRAGDHVHIEGGVRSICADTDYS
jgi:hypothetical protein